MPFTPNLDNLLLWPSFSQELQVQSKLNYIQMLATCIRDRILQSGFQHAACAPEATQDNCSERMRDIDSLASNYSQVTQLTQPMGGILWPDINHPTFNLPPKLKLRKLQNVQRDFALLDAFSQCLLNAPGWDQMCIDTGNTNENISEENLKDFNDASALVGGGTEPERLGPPDYKGPLYLEAGSGVSDCELIFPGLQVRDIDMSLGDTRNTITGSSSSKYALDISFQELLAKPLGHYQDDITLSCSLGPSQVGERITTTINSEHMSEDCVLEMSPWKHSIDGKSTDLPHVYGNGDLFPVTNHGSPEANDHHTHPGNDLDRRQSKRLPRQYLCPISSCSRNRTCTGSKRLFRSDNLGDHLRRVHKLAIPARVKIRNWVLENQSLWKKVDEQMQVLYGGSSQ